MDKGVMTVKEVADYLGLSTISIYKHAQKGDLPAFKIGNSWRFKRDSIDRWITDDEQSRGRLR
ncbi:MAG: helix-turn-helix domain-containing protein [Candidatus Omnitrophica bacterium]|nr:helix-turn-helix domain-containing protein [Candidatus Omnitrophota bacterium]